MKKAKIILISFLLGSVFGILVGASVKYPMSIKELHKIEDICKSHNGWDTFDIRFSGHIHSVKCKDGVIFNLEKIPQSQQ